MTPDKPDIDFKLDRVKWGLVYLRNGDSSHNHIPESIYCSVNPQSLYKGTGSGV